MTQLLELLGPICESTVHNIATSVLFGNSVYRIQVIANYSDIALLSERFNRLKNGMVAWDTESIDANVHVCSIQLYFGEDVVYFIPLSYDNEVRNSFFEWFPRLFGKTIIKVSFAITENQFILRVFNLTIDKTWLRISDNVDVQTLLRLKTGIVYNLELAYNVFYTKFNWKRAKKSSFHSIDIKYACADAVATYKIAQKLLIEPELITIVPIIGVDRQEIIEAVDKSKNKFDFSFDLNERLKLDVDYVADDTPIEGITTIEDFKIVNDVAKNPFSLMFYDNIDFLNIDKVFVNICVDVGLITEQQSKPYLLLKYYKENEDFRVVFKQMKEEHEKQVKVTNFYSGNKNDKKDVRVDMLEEWHVDHNKVKSEIDNIIQLISRDSAMRNRCRNGMICDELAKIGFPFTRIDKVSGPPHDTDFTVTLSNETLNIILVEKAKKCKDAYNGCLRQLLKLLKV